MKENGNIICCGKFDVLNYKMKSEKNGKLIKYIMVIGTLQKENIIVSSKLYFDCAENDFLLHP